MLDWLADLWNSFSSVLLSFLPTSPFVQWINVIGSVPYLNWLNWFIPVGDFIKIGAVYLSAVTIFYMYQIIARWLKVIGD